MECDTVDGTKMTFDPSKLLFIGRMEEPEDREESQGAIWTLKKMFTPMYKKFLANLICALHNGINAK